MDTLAEKLKTWKARLAPVVGAVVAGVFVYWMWIFRGDILSTFQRLGLFQLAGLAGLVLLSIFLTALALSILVRAKGYTGFGLGDAWQTLNLTQVAAMIPGGVWGFAGFAGLLWARRISRMDSIIIIFLNTLVMLTACAMVGFSGLASTLGWGYALACFLPFLLLLFSRNQLEALRQKYRPESSSLPSALAFVQALAAGVLVWVITAAGFAWVLYTSTGFGGAPFWLVLGAYATGYLGGYIAILVPSGLGVSEGLTTLLLSAYVAPEKALAAAVSFRIFHSLVLWLNILGSVILDARRR